MTQDLMTRQAFWLLQKYTSYTWKAEIAKHYTILTDAFEQALRHPPAGFVVDNRDKLLMRSLWEYQSSYEDGLDALLRGDKYLGYEKLNEGFKFPMLFFFDPIDNKEPEYIDPAGLQYHLGLRKLGTPCEDLFKHLSTGHKMDISCIWYSKEELFRSFLNLVTSAQNENLQIPLWLHPSPAELPTPPEPPITVNTGEEISVTGIWLPEPLQPLTSREQRAFYIFTETYCMNFLVQGEFAPEMVCQEIEEGWYAKGAANHGKKRPRSPFQNVRWTLIWKDDRYGANGIPADEVDYLRKADATPDAKTSQIGDRCDANLPCPRAGYWSTPAKQNSRHYFNQGEIMPDFTSLTHGNVIWYWDDDQAKR
jgi:hypothetical protein